MFAKENKVVKGSEPLLDMQVLLSRPGATADEMALWKRDTPDYEPNP